MTIPKTWKTDPMALRALIFGSPVSGINLKIPEFSLARRVQYGNRVQRFFTATNNGV